MSTACGPVIDGVSSYYKASVYLCVGGCLIELPRKYPTEIAAQQALHEFLANQVITHQASCKYGHERV